MSTRLSEMNLPRYPLLSDDEMMRLLQEARNGDKKAREKMINCNLKLVFRLVQRFAERGHDLEDLFQIGTIGLMKAIDKFDLSYHVKFSTYAVPMIIGEIRRFLRDDHPVKVSRSLKEKAHKIHHKKGELINQLGREPTIGEISDALGMGREEIVAALEAIQFPTSIHETLYQDEGDPIFVLDQLKDGSSEGSLFDKLAVREVLRQLSPKERSVILMRFFEDKTQTEVANILGLSQVQVSRLERQTLKKMRSLLASG